MMKNLSLHDLQQSGPTLVIQLLRDEVGDASAGLLVCLLQVLANPSFDVLNLGEWIPGQRLASV